MCVAPYKGSLFRPPFVRSATVFWSLDWGGGAPSKGSLSDFPLARPEAALWGSCATGLFYAPWPRSEILSRVLAGALVRSVAALWRSETPSRGLPLLRAPLASSVSL
jgi:hypothetical protein